MSDPVLLDDQLFAVTDTVVIAVFCVAIMMGLAAVLAFVDELAGWIAGRLRKTK